MDSLLLHYLESYKLLAYLIIFIAMIFEGDVVLFLAFYLAHQGYFKLSNIIAVAIVGILLGDLGWYHIGKYLENAPLIKNYFKKIGGPIDYHLKKNPFRAIFISKFMYGIHHALLMRAGALRVNLKKFFQIDILASLTWIAAIGLIGYFSSASISMTKHYIKYTEIGVLIGIMILFLITRSISRLTKKSWQKDENRPTPNFPP